MKAFPQPTKYEAMAGMNLRDYFAAKLMAAFATKELVSIDPQGFAKRSYEIADVMMKARQQGVTHGI